MGHGFVTFVLGSEEENPSSWRSKCYCMEIWGILCLETVLAMYHRMAFSEILLMLSQCRPPQSMFLASSIMTGPTSIDKSCGLVVIKICFNGFLEDIYKKR